MSTINQLVTNKRKKKTKKSKSTVLNVEFNTLERNHTEQNSPHKIEISTLVG